MRVVFLSTRSPWPLDGGHPLRTFHLLKEAARRHEVTLLTFIKHEEEWDGLSVLRRFCHRVVALPIPSEVNRFVLTASVVSSLATDLPFVATKYDSPGMRQALASALSEPVDLVHVDILPLAWALGTSRGTPTVLVEHNVEHLLLERRAALESPPARLFWRDQAARVRSFEAQSLAAATRCIAVSATDAGELRALAPSAGVRVVPNGVDLAATANRAAPSNPDEVLFLGSFTHFPNVDAVHHFVREIWPLVRARRPRATFTMVGVRPPRSVRALASAPGVRLVANAPAVLPHLRSAAVCIAPLRAGSGSRLKILEAMGATKPVVTTSLGCEGLDVVPERDLAVADDPASFAARTVDLLARPDLAMAMGARARARVEQLYGWERLGQLQEEVHREAVAAAREPGRRVA